MLQDLKLRTQFAFNRIEPNASANGDWPKAYISPKSKLKDLQRFLNIHTRVLVSRSCFEFLGDVIVFRLFQESP